MTVRSIAKIAIMWVDANWIDGRAYIDHAVVTENMANRRPVAVLDRDHAVRAIRLVDDHILEIADER